MKLRKVLYKNMNLAADTETEIQSVTTKFTRDVQTIEPSIS